MTYQSYGVMNTDGRITISGRPIEAASKRQAALDRNALLAQGWSKAVTYCGAQVYRIQPRHAPVN